MNFSNLLYIFLGCCLVSSCTRVLDKKDLSAVNEQDVWNDLDLATAYVHRLYAQNLPGWSTEYADYSEESDGAGGIVTSDEVADEEADREEHDHQRTPEGDGQGTLATVQHRGDYRGDGEGQQGRRRALDQEPEPQ